MLIGQRGIFLVPSLLQEFVGICWNLAPQACFNISNFQHLQSPAEVCGKDTCRMQQQPLSKASSTSNIFFHREVFTQRIFTHGSFHTEMFLHREVFTQRSFHTHKFLHREVFTRGRFYTKWKVEIGSNSLGKTVRRSFREQAFPTCSKKKPPI